MDRAKVKELEQKILEGLQLTHDRLIEDKIKKDQSLVYSYNGKLITIKARELHKLKDLI